MTIVSKVFLCVGLVLVACGKEKESSDSVAQSSAKDVATIGTDATGAVQEGNTEDVTQFSMIDTGQTTWIETSSRIRPPSTYDSYAPASTCRIWSSAVSAFYGRTLWDLDTYDNANRNEQRCIGNPGSDNWTRVYSGRGYDHAIWAPHHFPSGSTVSATFKKWVYQNQWRSVGYAGTQRYQYLYRAFETRSYSVAP